MTVSLDLIHTVFWKNLIEAADSRYSGLYLKWTVFTAVNYMDLMLPADFYSWQSEVTVPLKQHLEPHKWH